MSSSEIRRGSPYQGLIPYSEADSPFFFGREKETRLIIANLFASPLTLLYGASGVGKSSVLRAGVARQLREREDLLVVVFNSWQTNPVVDLIQAIANQAMVTDPTAWSRAASMMPRDGVPSLGEVLAICADQFERRLMIILDQFEEYFLYHPLDDEFAAEFSKAVTKPNAPVSFLISIREDFYAKLDRFEGRIPSLYDNYLRIEHLDRKAARIAIEQPIAEYNQRYAADAQFTIEPELVSAVLRQVETGQVIIGEAGRGVIEAATPHEDSEAQIETPFLQLVMTRLWEKELAEGSHRLRLETLERLGGAENIVRTHLDAVIARLTTREQDVAANIFHYLVTPSGTKIAYSASDLAGSANLSQPEVFGVLEKLSHGDVRILRPVDPPVDRPTAPRYEIFHDVLAPAILTWRTSYVQAQERAEAERRAEEQQQRADEQAAIANRFRRLTVVLAVVILLALGAAVFAVAQTVRAKANAARADNYAQESQKLRVEGQRLRDEGARLKASGEKAQQAAMIAQERVEIAQRKTEQQIKIAEQRKADALKAQTAADVASSAAAASETKANKATIAAKNQASATRVSFSNLLSVQSKTQLTENPQLSTLLAVEALRATTKDDPPTPAAEGALRLSLAQAGGRAFSGKWDENEGWGVKEVAVSPDGRWLVSASATVVRLFDLNIPDASAPARTFEGAGTPVAFSPDGRWLIAAGKSASGDKPEDKTRQTHVLLWDLNTRTSDSPPIVLEGSIAETNRIMVSPDNRWLVAAAVHTNAAPRLWDLKSSERAAKTLSVRAPATSDDLQIPHDVFMLAISPDSHWLVTSAGVGKERGWLKLWDLTAHDPTAKPLDLFGHKSPVSEVVFSPNGNWMATTSVSCDDGVRLWQVTTQNPTKSITLDHKGPIGAVAFSSDNHWLFTGSGSTENCNIGAAARVWDLTAGDISSNSWTLPAHEGPIFAATFSPDNSFLITVAGRGYSVENGSQAGDVRGTRSLGNLERGATIHAWYWGAFVAGAVDLSAEALPNLLLRDPQDTADVFTVSPNRRWLVGRSDNRAVVWDLTYSGGSGMWPSIVLLGHDSDLSAISFSPDSRRLVTGSYDKTARLWNLSDGSFAATPVNLPNLAYNSPIAQSDDRSLLVATEDEAAPPGESESSDSSYARSGAVAVVTDLTASNPAARRLFLRGHKGKIKVAAFSSDKRWLVTGGNDKTARLWDLSNADPAAHPLVFAGHLGAVDDVAISADKHWLATAGHDGVTRLWDLTAADPTARPFVLSTFKTQVSESYQYSNRVFISSDSRWLVTSGFYYFRAPATLWDLKAPDLPASRTELGMIDTDDVAFSPDGRWLLVLRNLDEKAESKGARLWDLTQKPLASRFLVTRGSDKFIFRAAFTSDGRWLFTNHLENTIRRWDLSAPDPTTAPFLLTSPLSEPGQNLLDFALSPNKRWLVADAGQGKHILWDLSVTDPNTARYLLKNPDGSGKSQVAFSKDSRWLVTSDDMALSETVKILSKRDLSASGTHNLRWDLTAPDPSAAPVPLPGQILISSAAVIGDGRWLITHGTGGLDLWPMQLKELTDLACRTAGRNLSEKEEWKTYFSGQPYRKTCNDFPAVP